MFVVSLNSDVDYGVVVLKILFQGEIILVKFNNFSFATSVRMAERSKALRSGRSPSMRAWVRIPLLTVIQPLMRMTHMIFLFTIESFCILIVINWNCMQYSGDHPRLPRVSSSIQSWAETYFNLVLPNKFRIFSAVYNVAILEIPFAIDVLTELKTPCSIYILIS